MIHIPYRTEVDNSMSPFYSFDCHTHLAPNSQTASKFKILPTPIAPATRSSALPAPQRGDSSVTPPSPPAAAHRREICSRGSVAPTNTRTQCHKNSLPSTPLLSPPSSTRERRTSQ
ncbi:unnamed protein product [Mesocestoides corti]|uniref:Dihydroorotase n=1 Tax=Mesocestoides corti TaxID=53468 RepID=A0A0R3U8S9_MESCO|nr:unnamed protein product [Mesocestoides corti]